MAARFVTFQDSPHLVSNGGVPFNTPGVDNTRQAYLSFRADPDLTNGPSVNMRVYINVTELDPETYTSEDSRVYQVNIPTGILQPNNTLTLVKSGGLGEISVSDCTVHYQT